MVSKKIILGIGIFLIISLGASVSYLYLDLFKETGFFVRERSIKTYDYVLNEILNKEDLIGVNQILLKVLLKEGSSLEKEILVENLAERELYVKLDSSVDGISLNEREFMLVDNKLVKVNFSGQHLGVHSGKLIFSVEENIIDLPIVFEVESENLMFDVNLDVSPDDVVVEPGEEVSVNIKLFNLFSIEKSINVEYLLHDLDQNLYFSEMENLIIEKDTSYVKSFVMPQTVETGKYVFIVKLNYEGNVGVGSYVFDVNKENFFEGGVAGFLKEHWLNLIILFVLIFVLIEVIIHFNEKGGNFAKNRK